MIISHVANDEYGYAALAGSFSEPGDHSDCASTTQTVPCTYSEVVTTQLHRLWAKSIDVNQYDSMDTPPFRQKTDRQTETLSYRHCVVSYLRRMLLHL